MLEYTRHNLYSKIAEKISRNYDIDWDNISSEEADDAYDDAVHNICFYEELLDEYRGEFELEEYQEVISRLMENYIAIAILDRRTAIEDLIEGL